MVIEFAELLRAYRITKVVGDRFGGKWPRERFRERGIGYEPAARAKSELYVTLLAKLNSRRIELTDDKRLVTQLASLDRPFPRRRAALMSLANGVAPAAPGWRAEDRQRRNADAG